MLCYSNELSLRRCRKIKKKSIVYVYEYHLARNKCVCIIFRIQSGTLTLVGLAGQHIPKLPLLLAISREVKVKGTYAGSRKHVQDVFALIQEGKVLQTTIWHVDSYRSIFYTRHRCISRSISTLTSISTSHVNRMRHCTRLTD